jgi:hypothetical protein
VHATCTYASSPVARPVVSSAWSTGAVGNSARIWGRNLVSSRTAALLRTPAVNPSIPGHRPRCPARCGPARSEDNARRSATPPALGCANRSGRRRQRHPRITTGSSGAGGALGPIPGTGLRRCGGVGDRGGAVHQGPGYVSGGRFADMPTSAAATRYKLVFSHRWRRRW